MSERQLPWRATRPKEGSPHHAVVDSEGHLVALCFGEDRGHDEAVAICQLANRAGDPICANCGEEATCFGSYETELTPAYACDECCGHGNEDGSCGRIADDKAEGEA